MTKSNFSIHKNSFDAVATAFSKSIIYNDGDKLISNADAASFNALNKVMYVFSVRFCIAE